MSVHHALFRVYRPIIVVFAALLLLFHVSITSVIVAANGHIGFSMWLVLAGEGAKYWVLVVGIMLVVMQLRQFVTNGVTRREFLAGAAVFGLIVTAGFAAVVVLGHSLESLALGAVGGRGDGYPTLSAGGILGEFGQVFPESLGYMVSGALIAAGFYRWRPWLGLIVMLGGAIPALVGDVLFGVDEFGDVAARLPYSGALALSLGTSALACAAFRQVLSDVPIKRTAG
jgi:hypothetical protein